MGAGGDPVAGRRVVSTFLILAAAMATAVLGVLAKEAFLRGSEPISLLCARYLLAAVILGAASLPAMRALPSREDLRRVKPACVIGLILAVGGLAEFEAISRLPVAVVIVIVFVNPVWIAVYLRRVRRQPIGRTRIAALAAVTIGVFLLVGPAFGDYDQLGIASALIASILFAAFLLALEKAVEEMPAAPAMAFGTASAALILFAIEPSGLKFEFGDDARDGFVIGVGVAAAISYWTLAAGARRAPVLDVAVLAGTEPLFTAIIASLALDESLSAVQLLGAATVVAGAVVISAFTPLGVTGPDPPAR